MDKKTRGGIKMSNWFEGFRKERQQENAKEYEQFLKDVAKLKE